VDVNGLEDLRDTLQALQVQGVQPDSSAAGMAMLTSKVPSKDISSLKRMLPRKGFVEEWESLDKDAKAFSKLLLGKEAATPSATWKLLTSYKPEAVLWLALTGKGAAIQNKFKNFFTVWPESRQRIPYAMMQEMRIIPSLPGYQDLQRTLFFQFMDGKLQTEEEVRKFLEPYSPPAPPPPVSLRRPRAMKKAEPKISKKAAKAAAEKAAAAAAAAEAPVVVAETPPAKPAEVNAGKPAAVAAKTAPVAKAPLKAAGKKAAPKALKKAPPAKKAAAKKAAPKKAAAKKPVAKKTAAKKAPAKKSAAKKAAKPAKKKR
jgi:hypothetical protein